ncbi:AI-2E family transporter [Noviherbaspirillum pedocola]|uniref:AI-2E family transporter n=1 Tax=Noviherbaspirillum pedocola TaxID=2801341 RepID=A0A934SWD1_9BURK|nr:AI-2E family transporter [Noviherbaspirillum pedocola]MBK4736623.1 AI-2E family transporter [Noviherbaspirillum pedocola]
MPSLSALLPWLFVAGLALLLQHFLGALAWAALLAIITWPLHQGLQRRGWPRAVAAAALVLALVMAFVAPSIFLFNTLSAELSSVERILARLNATGVPAPEWLTRLPLVAKPVLAWWQEHLAVPGGLNAQLQSIAGGLAPHLTSTVGTLGPTILANALYLFLALLTLFVLFVEGPAVIRYVDRAGMRVSAEYYPVLRRLLPLSVRGTALGLCSVALLEGVVLGIAYMVAGAPAPALLGVVTGYMALIPGGAPLSFTVVSLFLLGSGNPGPALGLFCWGCFELFLVDKFVRPKLIGHRVDLPFLAVLFGLLGGVSTIGVLGLFVGPFLMAVLFWWLRGGKVEAVIETREDEMTV